MNIIKRILLKLVGLELRDVEWVVNDMGELGVKIGSQFFFMYKGRSYDGGIKWRPIGKREFGETCQAEEPWDKMDYLYEWIN